MGKIIPWPFQEWQDGIPSCEKWLKCNQIDVSTASTCKDVQMLTMQLTLGFLLTYWTFWKLMLILSLRLLIAVPISMATISLSKTMLLFSSLESKWRISHEKKSLKCQTNMFFFNLPWSCCGIGKQWRREHSRLSWELLQTLLLGSKEIWKMDQDPLLCLESAKQRQTRAGWKDSTEILSWRSMRGCMPFSGCRFLFGSLNVCLWKSAFC